MQKILAALAISMLLFAAGCGGDDSSDSDSAESEESSAPTAESIQACIEEASFEVELQSGEIDQLLVSGGETEGGTTVAFYPTEAEATENAKAAKNVTGGEVTQNGTIVVITHGGTEATSVEECAAA